MDGLDFTYGYGLFRNVCTYTPFFVSLDLTLRFISKAARSIPGDLGTGKTGEISFTHFAINS